MLSRFAHSARLLIKATFTARPRRVRKVAPPVSLRGRPLEQIALFVCVLVLSSIAGYFKFEDRARERLDFVLRTAVVAAAGASLMVAYQTSRLNVYKDQVKGAFEIIAKFDDSDNRKQRDRVDKLLQKTGFLQEYRFDAIPEARLEGFLSAASNKDLLAARSVVSFFEDLALTVRCGYANEAVLFRSLGPVALLFLDGLRPYIYFVQRRDRDVTYYEDALILYDRWKHGYSIVNARDRGWSVAKVPVRNG